MACVRCKLLVNTVCCHFIGKSAKSQRLTFKTSSVIYQRKRNTASYIEQNVYEAEKDDFYGIEPNDSESGSQNSVLSAGDIKKKYKNYTLYKGGSEFVVELPFGHIRYDKANRLKTDDASHDDWGSVDSSANLAPKKKENSSGRLSKYRARHKSNNENGENTKTTITPEFLKELPESNVTSEQYFGLLYDIKAMGLEDKIPKHSLETESFPVIYTNRSQYHGKIDSKIGSKTKNNVSAAELVPPEIHVSSFSKGADQSFDVSQNSSNFLEDQYFLESSFSNSSEFEDKPVTEFNEQDKNNHQTLDSFSSFSPNVKCETSENSVFDNRIELHQRDICDNKESYNFIDEQYFGDSEATSLENRHRKVEGCDAKERKMVTDRKDSGASFIENQYFGDASSMDIQTNHPNVKEEDILSISDSYSVLMQTDERDSNVCDDSEKTISLSDQDGTIEKDLKDKSSQLHTDQKSQRDVQDIDAQMITGKMKTFNTSHTAVSDHTPTSFSYDFAFSEKSQEEELQKCESSKVKPKSRWQSVKQGDGEKKRTAYEYVMSAREPKVTNPRMVGANKINSFIPNIDRMTKGELVDLLQESVIYNKDDIVAINKPYGLPSKPGPNVRVSVTQLLDALAERLNHDHLYLVHRLDKETTGVMLLAKSMKTHRRLQDAFLQQEVIKKYVTITKGLPKLEEGIIDIPIGEGQVHNKVRMKLLPKIRPDGRTLGKSPDGHKAMTRFRVMSSNHNAALIECQPATGVKHQIRVHLAFGLNTPILGDHKYSHMDKIAPQKLHGDFLNKLDIPQTKVRYIPMHLHASSLTIPHFLDGRNLHVACQMSPLLKYSIKKLKLIKTKGMGS